MTAEVTCHHDAEIAVVTIVNPPMNVLTGPVRAQLHEHLGRLAADGAIRAVVLTGDGGRAFCAGADLREEQELTADTVRRFLDEDRRTYDQIEAMPVPVIAAVNGYCMGGGLELALACDVRLAATHAKFCAPGAKIGLVANAARLVHVVGAARARDLVLTARTFDAAEAERIGLVSSTFAAEDVMPQALCWAHRIGANAPLAVAAAKRVIASAARLDLEAGLQEELAAFARMVQTNDHKVAVRAFFEKRKPVFTGE